MSDTFVLVSAGGQGQGAVGAAQVVVEGENCSAGSAQLGHAIDVGEDVGGEQHGAAARQHADALLVLQAAARQRLFGGLAYEAWPRRRLVK